MFEVLGYWKTCEKMDWQNEIPILKCCVLFMVLRSKMKGLSSNKQMFLIYQFAIYFGLDVPSSGSSRGNAQVVTDCI
jgi:hypothetical protein